MKKTLLITTFLTGLTVSQGEIHAINMDKLKGFYIGVGVGAMSLSTRFEIDSIDGAASDRIKKNLSNTNVSFQGMIGYEKTFGNDYVAGIEAQYIWTRNRADTLNNLKQAGGGGLVTFSAKDSLKVKDSYGIAATFGRHFDAITPYVKIGIISTSFEFKASSTDGTKNIGGTDNKRRYGLSLGGGLRYGLNASLDVITEFQALMYRSIQSKNFDTDAGDSHIIKTRPTLYNIWAGIRWKF